MDRGKKSGRGEGVNVPVLFLSPHLDGSGHEDLTELLDLLSRLDLQGETRLPLGHLAVLLGNGEKHSVGAVQGADSALANTLVVVVSQGHDLLNGLLEVWEERAAGVGNQVTNNLNSDFLLEGQGSGGSDVIPGILIILDVNVLNPAIELIIVVSTGNLDLVAGDSDLLANKILGVLTQRELHVSLVLLNTGEKTVHGTLKEGREVLAVDLGHGTPEDVGALLEARVAKVKSLLGSPHQRLDVGLVALRASGRSHLTHSISDAGTEIELLLAVLDGSELLEEVHGLIEEGEEGLSSRGSERTHSTGGEGLDLEVGVLEEVLQNGDELGEVRSNILLLKTINDGIDGADTDTEDVDDRTLLLTLVLLDGSGDVLEEQRHEGLVLSGEVLREIVGQTSDSVKRSHTDLVLAVGKKLQDHGEDLLHLGANEVGGTLNTHTQSQDTSATVVGIAAVEVLAKSLEQRNNDLGRRETLGQLVKEGQGRAGRSDIVIGGGVVVKLGDNVQSSAGELLTNAQALDLHLAVLDDLHQEADGLGTGILLALGVGSDLVHEHDQVLEVDGQQSRVAAQEGLEDLKGLHDTILLVLVDGVLEHGNHGGNHVLEGLDGAGVQLRLEVLSQLAQRQQSVDADLGTLGILDGLAKQGEQVLELLLESLTKGLQDCEENVDGDRTLVRVTLAGSSEQGVGEVKPLAVLEVNLGHS